MKAFTYLLALFAVASAFAQDVPPPPRPPDDGPSLETTMKFIEEKLDSIGHITYMMYTHNNLSEHDSITKRSNTVSNVQVSIEDCRIDFDARATANSTATPTILQVLYDGAFGFALKDTQDVVVMPEDQFIKAANSKAGGHPELDFKTSPPVFVVSVRGKIGDKNTRNDFHLYDESLANRIAKAIVHAVELCGGGSKDPF